MDVIVCGEFIFSSATLPNAVVGISSFELRLAVKPVHSLNTAAHEIVRSSTMCLSYVLVEIVCIQ